MKFTILLIVTIFSFAFAQEEIRRRDRVRLGGHAHIGADFRAVGGLGGREINDSRLHRIGIVETQFDIRPAQNIRLEFDLEFDWRFTDINLNKLYIRYDFDNSHARLGFMRKMFTLEEMKRRRDRVLIRRSMINDVLEDFFLLGHDFTLQYRHNFEHYMLIAAFSGDGGGRIFGNLTLLTNFFNRFRFVAGLKLANFEEKDGRHNRQNSFFTNAGIEFRGRRNNFEFEGVWGKNPERYGFLMHQLNPDGFLQTTGMYFRQNPGNGFGGMRFQQSFPINTSLVRLPRIIPVYEIAYFSYIFGFSRAYYQVRPGINFSFAQNDRLQWRTNLDIIFTANNQANNNHPQIVRQRIISELFLHW